MDFCLVDYEVEVRVLYIFIKFESWEEEEGFLIEKLVKVYKFKDEIFMCFKYRGWIIN